MDPQRFLFLISPGLGRSEIKCPICLDFLKFCEGKLIDIIKDTDIGLRALSDFYNLDFASQVSIIEKLPKGWLDGYNSPYARLVKNDFFAMTWLKTPFVKMEEYLIKNQMQSDFHNFATYLLEYIVVMPHTGEERKKHLEETRNLLEKIRDSLQDHNLANAFVLANDFYYKNIEPLIKTTIQGISKFEFEKIQSANDFFSLYKKLVPFSLNYLPVLTISEKLALVRNKFSNMLVSLSTIVGLLVSISGLMNLG